MVDSSKAYPGRQRMRSLVRWARERDVPTLVGCTIGLVASLLAYGILQERVMTQPYGADQVYFTNSLFLVFANRSVGVLVVLLAMLARGEDPSPHAPLREFVSIALGNVLATTCQYEALKYVSFPVATLAKCAKMLPVVAWGSLAHKKVYPRRDYACALFVFLGCSLFLLTGDVKSHLVNRNSASATSSSSNHNLVPVSHEHNSADAAGATANNMAHTVAHVASGLAKQVPRLFGSKNAQEALGISLLFTYLALDGFTSTAQDETFKTHQPSSLNMILYTTLCSTATTAIGLSAGGQSLIHSLRLLTEHPVALGHVLCLSLAACFGQVFIAHTVKLFGALVFATVMTLRQFASILLSCAIFKHPLTLGQWVGTAIVFAALHLKTLSKKRELSESDRNSGSLASAAAAAAAASESVANGDATAHEPTRTEGQQKSVERNAETTV